MGDASRGGLNNSVYSWGNEKLDDGNPKANTWEGVFPYSNTHAMVICTLRQLKAILQMVMVYTIFREMSGSGVQTGIMNYYSTLKRQLLLTQKTKS